MEKKVLVIIPAYNEEASIESVIKNLRETVPEYDYIVINDCSTDGTAEILDRGGYNRLNMPNNLGIGGGVQTGYRYAVENGYDAAVQMDGDGQHDPAYLKAIVDPVLNGDYDLCIGSRFIEHEGFQTSAMRRFGIRFLSGIIKLCSGVKTTDATSGFRACSRRLAEHYTTHYAQDYPEPEAIVSASIYGFRLGEVPVVMRERQGGVSSISPLRSVYFMMKVSIAILLYRFLAGKKRNDSPAGD